MKEDTRDAGGGTFLESVWQDLRYATRVLRKSKGFTAVAIVTLALGIGANAVVFGVLNALVLRPMNLPQESSLYSIEQGDNGFGSYPDYLDMRDQQPQLRESGRVQRHRRRTRHGRQSVARRG